MLKFHLRGGKHQCKDSKGRLVTYNRGDLVETEDELDKMFGGKFVRLNEQLIPVQLPINKPKKEKPEEQVDIGPQSPSDPYGLKKMTKPQLIEFAEGEEIELTSTKKSDILAEIQAAID